MMKMMSGVMGAFIFPDCPRGQKPALIASRRTGRFRRQAAAIAAKADKTSYGLGNHKHIGHASTVLRGAPPEGCSDSHEED
ncbi:hypothetical protein Vadar_027136 [Vaccinium darrowii]|uniref:Uncharacterized protein n=1 Tax=Vaccinium darrowii TaxID=229202 RepID=A0ACB7XV53_9ERIC|nr:hypothetical protein Vadar_027136 [Vaccinium darrowii]